MRNITDFFGNEYRQQAQNANFTKLANIFGLKFTANKVACTTLLKNITAFTKVEVLSNMTALETLYIGGSTNIDGVIVNMATSYTGSNNVPILATKGDFGSRLNSAAAASRYIFTKKSDYFDMLFNKEDLNILPRYNFEGQEIEYKFLTFNLPLLLINGSEGMGSGHAQKILPRNPKDCLNYIKEYLKTGKQCDIPVYYNGFRGTVKRGDNGNQWITTGVIKRVSSFKTEIIEVSIGESYKSIIKKLDKLKDSGVIKDYTDKCDPKKDIFLIEIQHDIAFGKLSDDEMLEKLKLISTDSENFTVIDEKQAVKVFKDEFELFNYYIKIRLEYMQLRKDYLIKKYLRDIDINNSKYIFIKSIIDGDLVINKRAKTDIIKDIEKIKGIVTEEETYDYLLRMPIYSLTIEKMQELAKQIEILKVKLEEIKKKDIKNMWLDDLVNIKL